MSVRQPLNVEENAVAAVAGLGIILAMVSGILIGFGDESDAVNTLFVVGLGLLGLGFVGWMVLLRPWENYDDLQTPLYKGHHHVEEETPAPDVKVTVENPLEETTSGAVVGAVVEPETAPLQVETEATTEESTEPVATEPVVETEVVEVEHIVEVEKIADDPVEEVAAPAVVDDLQLIEGIGNKSEQALKEYGITSFAQLAAYDPFELERLVKEELSVRLVGSTVSWVRQAQLAAKGDMDGLAVLQDKIHSGYLYDELTQITGIDEAMQAALYEARIRAYEELAVAAVDDLQKALAAADITAASHVQTWPQQAQLLVAGDDDALQELQDSL